MKLAAKTEKIKREIAKKGLSMNKTGVEVGIESGNFSKIVNGKAVWPKTAKKITDFLGFEVFDLFDEIE